MARDPAESDLRREANRRYWETSESVNGIAEAMELSKGRLYGLLESLPVEATCPECGGVLAFEHRTARDRGVLTCQSCGFEGGADEVEGGTEVRPHPAASRQRGAARTSGAGSVRPASRGSGPAGDGLVVGALLVGVAAGLALGRWLR
ncbi:MAG: hypothetical protein EA352_12320 [Gemmatimonadales bacterium]|nr:MAG: hypothetical protein EA352_12320 [Gemmatimonadales bacterium]